MNNKKSIKFRFGIIGIYLYNKYHDSKKWEQKSFIFKMFTLYFVAIFSLISIVIFSWSKASVLLWLLPLVVIMGLIYGFWGECFFQKQRSSKTISQSEKNN